MELLESFSGIWSCDPRLFRAIDSAVRRADDGGANTLLEICKCLPGDWERRIPTRIEGAVGVVEIDAPLVRSPCPLAILADLIPSVQVGVQIEEIAKREGVAVVVIHLDSAGGTYESISPVADAIRRVQRRQGRRVIAFVRRQAFGAAYSIAAACDSVVCSGAAVIGAIAGARTHAVPGSSTQSHDDAAEVTAVQTFLTRQILQHRPMIDRFVLEHLVDDGSPQSAEVCETLRLVDDIQDFDKLVEALNHEIEIGGRANGESAVPGGGAGRPGER